MGVLYPSYFLHRSAHFKLLRGVSTPAPPPPAPLLELPFLPPLTLKIKSINQKGWKGGGDMGTEGHLNPFRVPKLRGVKSTGN